MSEEKPLIAISTTFDIRQEEYVIPGIPACFASIEYGEAVAQAGGAPFLVPYLTDSSVIDYILRCTAGLVMTGGGGSFDFKKKGPLTLEEQNPARYEFDVHLIEQALSLNMPVLGICRGHQMIAEVTGGEVAWINSYIEHQQEGELESFLPRHKVKVFRDTHLYRSLGMEEIKTNSFHRQAVSGCGEGYRIAARAEDGIVEVQEKEQGGFVLGLQFHPEKMPREGFSQKIWHSFINAAESYSRNNN